MSDEHHRWCSNCYVRLPATMLRHIHYSAPKNRGCEPPDTGTSPFPLGRQTHESYPTVTAEEVKILYARLCEISSPAFEQEYPVTKDFQ